jgi:hypothetical protein
VRRRGIDGVVGGAMKILDELEALADEATPGGWRDNSSEMVRPGSVAPINPQAVKGQGRIRSICKLPGTTPAHMLSDESLQQAKANAAYIAAADPPTVKALVRVARAGWDDRDCLARPIREALDALREMGGDGEQA